jgi:hypothetical protein
MNDNWEKNMERSGCSLIVLLCQHLFGWSEENTRNLSQGSGWPGRDSNFATPYTVLGRYRQLNRFGLMCVCVCIYVCMYVCIYIVVLTRKAAMFRAKNGYFCLSIIRVLSALQYEFLLSSPFSWASCVRIRLSFSTQRFRMQIQGPDSRCEQPSFEEGSLIS